jgi:hypothetical protein
VLQLGVGELLELCAVLLVCCRQVSLQLHNLLAQDNPRVCVCVSAGLSATHAHLGILLSERPLHERHLHRQLFHCVSKLHHFRLRFRHRTWWRKLSSACIAGAAMALKTVQQLGHQFQVKSQALQAIVVLMILDVR